MSGNTALAYTRPEPAIKPLVEHSFHVPDSGYRFTAACFGGDTNWSLKPLQNPDDVGTNPELAAQVNEALYGMGARRAFAPNPVPSNGKIVRQGQLQRILSLGDVFLCRNQEWPGDGSFLHTRGDAGVISAGGCGFSVATWDRKMVFAHMSQNSLLDRHWVQTKSLGRSREQDVVDNLLDALCVPAWRMGEVHVWLFYFINPEVFAHNIYHPDHRAWNEVAAEFLPKHFPHGAWRSGNKLVLDLPAIATEQLRRRGIPLENINRDHQHLHKELSTTRSAGTDSTRRYLVTIVRH